MKVEPERRRKFDHDEARRLYAEGLSIYKLAARFGVHPTSVWYAVKHARK